MTGHDMPFGAAPSANGVRFRLWAPGARSVDLLLDHSEATMRPAGRGWFELFSRAASPGSHYRFRIDGGLEVPDPASRWQPEDVHGPSMVVDPHAWRWSDAGWRGRPWEEAVVYELHVGTFSPQGTFDGVRARLDHLAALGVTAVALMPVADFSGRRNWGYDGVLPFAPESAYGSPESLKRLVEAAHAHGLMILLDVVYNHFGPDGNYLPVHAPQFFTDRHRTPWGDAIDFAVPEVRDFFIHNALYWLEEYRFDGLRLDAVHAIIDESEPHFLAELAARVHDRFAGERAVHLILENEENEARWLARSESRPVAFTAQWNDDVHHACHVLATGEADAYYGDYAGDPIGRLCRCLAEGFAFQGEPMAHRDGRRRGEPSAQLPPAAFVAFLQNHDQVGNRAFGERLTALAEGEAMAVLAALLLLSPQVPMLFMGEEWGSRSPFLFFCDFHGDLAAAVRDGRHREFARFAAFAEGARHEAIPDPNDDATFLASRLDWEAAGSGEGARRLDLHRRLIAIRTREIVPRLPGMTAMNGEAAPRGERGLAARWRLGDGSRLHLVANLGGAPFAETAPGRELFALGDVSASRWAIRVTLDEGH
jgi:malto-oligosyltrehalose trehalohydrolase